MALRVPTASCRHWTWAAIACDRIQEYDQKHRYFLSCLPAEVRQQVAFGTAWRLMFGEDLLRGP